MLEKNSLPKSKAVFLVESQPPHMGELIGILNKMKDYSTLHICIDKDERVIPLQLAMTTWFFIMSHVSKVRPTIFAAKFSGFKTISKLPDQAEFKDCVILTTDKEIFIHLSSINSPVELVANVLGYHSTFFRNAYRQGRALDYLLQRKLRPRRK